MYSANETWSWKGAGDVKKWAECELEKSMGTGREQQKGGTKNPKKKQKLEKEEDGGGL